MKQIKSLIVTLSILAAGSAFAEKPEWAGKDNPAAEQKEAHKEAMNAKGEEYLLLEEEIEKSEEKQSKKLKKEKKEKKEKFSHKQQELIKDSGKSKDKPEKGLEKQKEKKASQEQKELDKGSEQGQESREQRRKWWKFWE